MNDFYFNRSRSASIENLNYFSGLEHTSSMIDNFFPVINKYKDGSREMDNLDHADLVW